MSLPTLMKHIHRQFPKISFGYFNLIYSCKTMNRLPCGLRLQPKNRLPLRVNLEQALSIVEGRVETCKSCN
jgi:hypothetical protein